LLYREAKELAPHATCAFRFLPRFFAADFGRNNPRNIWFRSKVDACASRYLRGNNKRKKILIETLIEGCRMVRVFTTNDGLVVIEALDPDESTSFVQRRITRKFRLDRQGRVVPRLSRGGRAAQAVLRERLDEGEAGTPSPPATPRTVNDEAVVPQVTPDYAARGNRLGSNVRARHSVAQSRV
jgi:hypothetical protein